MATLLEMVLSNILVASVLALGVAGLARILKRPALVHCLWVLVFLKLVTPPVVSVPVFPAGAFLLQAESAPVAVSPRTGLEGLLTSTAGIVGAVVTVEPDRSPLSPASSTPPEDRTPPAPAAGLRVSWLTCLLVVWGLGILAVFGLALWRTWRFRCLVRLAEPVPAAVQERTERLARRLGLARCPRVWRVPARISPLVWAQLQRPRLLLPARLLDTLSQGEVDCLLVHELAHVCRRDHLARLLELLVAGLFWWLPVVWLARRALRTAEEQCCDAWVTWSLPRRAEAYARALVKTVEFLAGARLAMPPAASGARHVRQLERRLTMIMERTPPRALTVAGRLAVAGLAVLMLSVLPTFAQEDSGEKEIHRVKMKLERVERAMAELRAAGLKEEVGRTAPVVYQVAPSAGAARCVLHGQPPVGPNRDHGGSGGSG